MNLREWVVSVLGEPTFYTQYRNAQGNMSTVNVQYDWAFITGALLMVICLWGFITILRMIFSRRR